MSFPTSPIAGQTAVFNGITYSYTTSTNTWDRVQSVVTATSQLTVSGTITGGSIRTTSTSTPPSNPTVGDIWYNTTDDTIYRYTTDGTTSVWLDYTGPSVGNAVNGTNVTASLIPTANISYDLGSPTNRFRTLYVSSSTIDIGGVPLSVSNGSLLVNGTSVTGNSTGTTSTSFAIGSASTSTATTVGLVVNTTDAIQLPSGTTAQRPAVPANGMMRYNSSTTSVEAYINGYWITVATGPYIVNYLVVGGGGSGGSNSASGGGAGAVITGTTAVTKGTMYAIAVGSGGSSVITPGTPINGNSGTYSLAFNTLAIGGYGAGLNTPGYGGNSGNGYAGGTSATDGATYGIGGGGGGSSGAGIGAVVSPSAAGGAGGTGTYISITGSAVAYGGGGGGAGDSRGTHPGGAGGTGGGGAGSSNGSATAGSAVTGGGGGGSAYTTPQGGFASGAGGSGVVIISYQSPAVIGTGGNITSYTTSGNTYYVHTFTATGTYTA